MNRIKRWQRQGIMNMFALRARRRASKNKVRNVSVYTLDSLYQCYPNADTMASPHIQYLYHTFTSNLCLTAEEQNGIFHLGFQERVLCLEEAPQPTYGSEPKALASLLTQNTQNKSRHIPTAFYFFYSNI